VSVNVIGIPHLVDDVTRREEFYSPLLNANGVAYGLRVEVLDGRTLRLVGMTSARIKLWEVTVNVSPQD